MIFAFDFHQCANYYPEVFASLARWLRASGHKVIILSAAASVNREWLKRDLAHWNIEYDEIIMPELEGSHLHYEEARDWKQQKITELNIDVLFEDNPELAFLNNVVIVG